MREGRQRRFRVKATPRFDHAERGSCKENTRVQKEEAVKAAEEKTKATPGSVCRQRSRLGKSVPQQTERVSLSLSLPFPPIPSALQHRAM